MTLGRSAGTILRMDQRDRYRSTPPQRTLDDMPLAAYGGTGMEAEDVPEPVETAGGQPALVAAPAATAASSIDTPPEISTPDGPTPEGEPGPSAIAVLGRRAVHLFRTSRVAAGAGFAVVIIVGLVLLSGGGASPAATAATPSKGPSAAPTAVPPSGDASLTVTGPGAGTFALTGLPGGQHVDATTVALGWGDALQTTLSIAGPVDRGTRTTDEHLVLTIGILVNGQPVTFTSTHGECTIGMAQVGLKVQGSFTCHKLRAPDGKVTIDANGTYHS